MNKTLLNHFTAIKTTKPESPALHNNIHDASLHGLVCELKQVLLQTERELLSPRPEAVKQLLSKVLN